MSKPATAPAARPKRNPLLAQLHIARKALALTDDSYRDVLRRVTGHESGAACTDAQLHKALAEFKRLGWKNKGAGKRPPAKPHIAKIYAVWRDMAPLVSEHTPSALRAFVTRQTGIAAPEFLNPEDANKVIEGLKAWRNRLLKGTAK